MRTCPSRLRVPERPALRVLALVMLWALLPAVWAAPAGADPTDDPSLDQVVEEDEEHISGEPAELDHGHVDIGPRLRDGKITLHARDDSETPVWRDMDDIVFRIHDAGKITLPDGEDYAFTGAQAGQDVYAVPQVEVPGVVWLGWNTQDPPLTEEIDRGVTLRLVDVQGPGDFTTFLQPGNFEPPDLLWDGQNSDPRELWVDLRTHTHANWVFTEPGEYLVALEVEAKTLDGTVLRDVQTLRFAVGDEASADAAREASWEAGRGPEQAQSEDSAEQPSDQGGTDSDAAAGPESSEEEGGLGSTLLIVGALAVVLVAGTIVVLLVQRRSRAAQRAAWEQDEGEDRP